MADRSKRQRISRAASTSQVTNNVPPMFGGSQPDARVASDGEPGSFVEGSILRIAMNNFLTYELAVVNPGANLNMIVGANGTGKSSIVCAICLGLAGKTALLGRGDKIGLFVKRGCSRGSIEIELYKNGGNVVINREISTENLSQWTLNGKSCSQKVVEEEVKGLQIQVSNLCQFLPQEKVGEFAKMSRIELLEATEKSVGPPEMYTYHCELKNFRGRERELENTVNEKAAFLERAKQKNESNKLDMNRYYEKKRHLDMIELLEKKKPWVEFEAVRKEHESVKTEREEVKKRLSSLKQTHGPMLKKIQLINNQLEPIEAQIKTKTFDIKEAARKCKARRDQLDRKQKEQALNLKHTEKVDEEKRIANTKTIIDDLQKELATVGEQPDVAPRIDAISVELRGHQEERARLDGEKSDIRREKDNMGLCPCARTVFTRRLNDMNNMMKAKEDKLKVRHKDTFTAIQWLRQNRQLFSGNVHEPMLLVVRDKLKLRVNSILAPAVSCANKQPSRPIESLKRFGFYSYLREMFDAPTDVVSYLCHQYNVHDVPVGTAQTKAMINKVIEEPYLKLIYTAEERYVVKKSMYSNHVSTNNSQLRPSKFLTISVDAEEKGQVEQQIQRKIKDLDERLAGLRENFSILEGRDNELRNEKKGLLEQKGKKRQLEQKIDAFTRLDTKKNQLHERCKGLMRSAQTICNMGAAGTVPAELKVVGTRPAGLVSVQAFSTLPDTMEELDALLNEECSRAEGFTGIRENVVEEYNRREVEIQNLEEELGDLSEALTTYRMNMSEAKERWLNPLRTLICQINERFGEYFRSMQCVGEVDLHSEKEEEYDKYGIRIRVKFHNSTELHELTAHHQSGGERSVSTMLYLMALQELNRCPFRVVDEINQGMDPINERRVFNIVVRTACKETTSQYFFITPKLLQDLQYAEEMTVLCIHNGPQMLSPGDWDEKAFLRRMEQPS
uniref:Structural maintenance of chromosomes protein 5 n=1 Tax=Gadus morhua TaxID=8049 RepID=A0A8C5B632_GADMO